MADVEGGGELAGLEALFGTDRADRVSERAQLREASCPSDASGVRPQRLRTQHQPVGCDLQRVGDTPQQLAAGVLAAVLDVLQALVANPDGTGELGGAEAQPGALPDDRPAERLPVTGTARVAAYLHEGEHRTGSARKQAAVAGDWRKGTPPI